MAEEYKLIPKKVSEFPEASTINDSFVIGVDKEGKSVKVPIALLKGNQGDAPTIGANGNWWVGGKDTGFPARGQDGEVTAAQLKEAFSSVENLASATNNGLMSIEHFNFIEDMATNMQDLIDAVKASSIRDEEAFESMAVLTFNNDAPREISQVFRIRGVSDIMSMKIKSKEYISPKETISAAKGVTVIPSVCLTATNDVMQVYFTGSDIFAIQNAETEILTHVALFDPKKKIAGFTCMKSKLKAYDLSFAKGVSTIYSQDMPNLEILPLNDNLALSSLFAFNNPKLKSVYLAGSRLKEARLYSCVLLTNLTVSNDMPDLITLELQTTAINKSTLMLIEAKWLSRVGKTVGSLKVSKNLYNELTDEDKLLFVNKNITIQFA